MYYYVDLRYLFSLYATSAPMPLKEVFLCPNTLFDHPESFQMLTRYKPTLKWFFSDQFWSVGLPIWTLFCNIAGVRYILLYIYCSLVLSWYFMSCHFMACASSLPKAFAASKQKEFREVWLQDVLGEPLLQFSKPAVGMVKVCKCSLKRKKPTTPAATKVAFGRVYIGKISKQCKWRRLRKAGVTMEKLGGSGHTGNHPGRCPKHGLLPRLAPVAVTEERSSSFCVLWHGQ